MLTTEDKKQRRKAILVLRENGFSVSLIAKMLNMSLQAVYQIINSNKAQGYRYATVGHLQGKNT